jgi:DNA-directed RNA polymerase specialized sigma24 family protein
MEHFSMADDTGHSVTTWIESLKSGDRDAAQKLWQRYFESLVRIARDKIGGAPRAVSDEEDAALSAFDSFVRGAIHDRYPQLGNRDDLWRLLVVITERKAIDHWNRERRRKRGGGKVVNLAANDGADDEGEALWRVSHGQPTPEFAALFAEECRRLLAGLRDDSLRMVAVLRMEGYTNEEIARQLRCSLRTVARKIELIRSAWLCEAEIRS